MKGTKYHMQKGAGSSYPYAYFEIGDSEELIGVSVNILQTLSKVEGFEANFGASKMEYFKIYVKHNVSIL